jgi:multimeric flavodoxin WrbA
MIWGTPVYFFDVTAQAKIIIDRLFHFYMNMMLTNKVAGVISVASSLGHQPVWNLFNTFFSINHMFFADFVYGYAPKKKGSIRKDKHAIKSAKELGKQVVLLVEKQYKYPQEYDLPIYRHVHEKLNIHMSPAMGRFD